MKERMSSKWSMGIEYSIGKVIPSGNGLKKAKSC